MSSARQFMNSKVESIPATETVDVAAQRMRDADVGALLVTDGAGILAGVITDRDIVTGCIASGHDPAKCQVSTLAGSAPVVVDAEADLAEILKTMGRSRCAGLPVTENGRLVCPPHRGLRPGEGRHPGRDRLAGRQDRAEGPVLTLTNQTYPALSSPAGVVWPYVERRLGREGGVGSEGASRRRRW